MKIQSLLSFLLISASAASAQTLTGFGTTEFTLFPGSETYFTSYNQTATTLNIVASDQGTLIAGLFATTPLSQPPSTLLLTATLTTNPASNFEIQLFDGENLNYTYSGNWSSFGTGSQQTVPLSLTSTWPVTFNLTTVQGFAMNLGGSGSTLNVTFDNLSAIPEPSTYAALTGLAALGLAAYRRSRRRQAA